MQEVSDESTRKIALLFWKSRPCSLPQSTYGVCGVAGIMHTIVNLALLRRRNRIKPVSRHASMPAESLGHGVANRSASKVLEGFDETMDKLTLVE